MAASRDRLERLERAVLYLVCSTRPGGHALADVLAPALAGGVDVVQLRDKDAADDELLAAAAIARKLCDDAGALLILNDRPDLVQAAKADGCHVGQDDVPVAEARALAGDGAIVGLSTHSPADIAGAGDADYIGVGPVYATPTKPGRPAVGLELVREAAAHAARPFFAIGGIDASNAGAVVAAGATRTPCATATPAAGRATRRCARASNRWSPASGRQRSRSPRSSRSASRSRTSSPR